MVLEINVDTKHKTFQNHPRKRRMNIGGNGVGCLPLHPVAIKHRSTLTRKCADLDDGTSFSTNAPCSGRFERFQITINWDHCCIILREAIWLALKTAGMRVWSCMGKHLPPYNNDHPEGVSFEDAALLWDTIHTIRKHSQPGEKRWGSGDWPSGWKPVAFANIESGCTVPGRAV